jgi:predicted dehydrogenase/threonine dehydrogenase-like Zn-dependent dehydrogenase
MKQILQNLGRGETELVEIPVPAVAPGCLLVRSAVTLVSLGTERMLVEFGRAGLLGKAMQQPEKVRQVLDKVRTDGVLPTFDAVRAKLDEPIAIGYCNAGVVAAIGEGCEGFKVGDRVASNGPHAEYVLVPKNLCAHIPDNVPDEDAAFTVAASIALEGIRLLGPTLGERVAVIGLGLVGQLAVQLLRANGVEVLGVDPEEAKCTLARSFGAQVIEPGGQSLEVASAAFSRGQGMDGVLIAASTRSSAPANDAARICRHRGRVVQIGATGLELERKPFYDKEISLQVSCSYGPGRYDPTYEAHGQDYPIGHVRWTEKRNFEAVLQLLASGSLRPAPLVTHRYAFADALKAYGAIGREAGAMGILLSYPEPAAGSVPARTVSLREPCTAKCAKVVVGVIGAGNYAGRVLLPALAASGVRLKTIASAGGVHATHMGRKFGFEAATSDAESLIGDPEINLVVIATRHDSHARYVLRALESGKAVFVEKPLCLTAEELHRITEAYEKATQPFLMVGFNRRFAPLVRKMRTLAAKVAGPKALVITVNAGTVPQDSWVKDALAGGGRLMGEGCHFIDLARYIVGCPIASLSATPMGCPGDSAAAGEAVLLNLRFMDGSVASIQYLGNGSKSFPKERVELFAAGGILQLDNHRVLRGYGWKGFRRQASFGQDKGHFEEIETVVNALAEGLPQPISFADISEVTSFTLNAAGQSS